MSDDKTNPTPTAAAYERAKQYATCIGNTEHLDRLFAELQAKLAEVERERESWEMTALDIQEKANAYRARVEGSPIAYLSYKIDKYGEHLCGASSCPWKDQEGYRSEAVHIVPISPESAEKDAVGTFRAMFDAMIDEESEAFKEAKPDAE